ncbi:S-adenosyl-L-methionine-dependent methyltransferase [Naviculisporaceae sp. PSN 640]
MASSEDLESSKKQYDTFAPVYLSIDQLPASKLETQQILTALGDCTGLHVLDLGGGNGLHAREAVRIANAASVDVVDISREMLLAGQALEATHTQETGQASKIRWFEADLSKSLDEQAVSSLDGKDSEKLRTEEGYDIVMANWLFDHATSAECLKAMYANVARYLKPHGGRFLGVRVTKLAVGYLIPGKGKAKYGVSFKDVEKMADGLDGWTYQVGMVFDPTGQADPFYFGASSMNETLRLKDGEEGGVGREVGLSQFWVVPPAEMELVKNDPEFWAEYMEEPYMAVVVARKE